MQTAVIVCTKKGFISCATPSFTAVISNVTFDHSISILANFVYSTIQIETINFSMKLLFIWFCLWVCLCWYEAVVVRVLYQVDIQCRSTTFDPCWHWFYLVFCSLLLARLVAIECHWFAMIRTQALIRRLIWFPLPDFWLVSKVPPLASSCLLDEV